MKLVCALSLIVSALALSSAFACGGDKAPRASELTVSVSSAVVPTPDSTASVAAGVTVSDTNGTQPDTWKEFSAKGVKLSLPGRYEGGDLSTDLDVLVERARNLGAGFDALADRIKQNPSIFIILAIDTSGDFPGSSVVVTRERTLSTDTLQSIESTLERSLPSSVEFLDHRIVTIGRYNAMSVDILLRFPSVDVREAVYLVKQNNLLFSIAYNARLEDFAALQPMIEQSLTTLTLP